MFTATMIVSMVLVALLVVSAYFKLTRREPYVQGYLRVGVPADKLGHLALLLLAAAAGLVAGLAFAPLGIAAAAGLVCYFALAIGAHLRVGDARNLPTPVALAILSVLALVLRIASL